MAVNLSAVRDILSGKSKYDIARDEIVRLDEPLWSRSSLLDMISKSKGVKKDMDIQGKKKVIYELAREGSNLGEENFIRISFCEEDTECFVLQMKCGSKVNCIKMTKPEVRFLWKTMRIMDQNDLFDY